MYKLRLILLHTLHKLLSVFPRSNKTWAFIGWNRTPDGEIFTDNTKYLYLYVLEHQLEIKPVWLAKSRDDAKKMRSMGMKSYYQFSLTGIFYALHAGVTIIDANLHDWNFVYVGRSKLVQLLHGKGMKAQGYSKPGLRDHDLICYPSAGVQSMISGAFAQNAIKKITGYPRSDIVMGEEYQYSSFGVDDKTKDLISELKRKETKIIWYAPTFRRGQQFFDVDKILNLSKLTPQLKQKNYHLLISLHPKYSSQNSTISNSNVSFLPAQDFFPLYQY
ncbi:CDP-glycerol glycerophosphotransferase family protein, partial [Candidatus Kaiserbacteria bacterium]|nr:CDP-glycerol glycerophosphotransferase family protein [Candidatus Kaiserbacteria bacterium]